jgi:hypothetical protein
VATEQVIKVSTLLPVSDASAVALAPMATVLERSMRTSPQSKWETYLTAWQSLALSMFEYRRGDFHQAVTWGQKCLAYQDATPTRIAISRLFLAMSFNRLHQPERARTELELARAAVESNLPDKLEQIPTEGTNQTGLWNDWVIAYLLLQEATRDMSAEVP